MSGSNRGGGNGPIVTVERVIQFVSAIAVLYIAWIYAAEYAEDHGGSIIPKFGSDVAPEK